MTPRMNPSPLLSTPNSSNLTVSSISFTAAPHTPDPLSCFPVHKDDISREQLKELLYEEIMSFRPAINGWRRET
jgi:hypothetical protein